MEVTFDIDANGIVNVTAKDQATGKEQKITVTASSGLSKEDVDRMVSDAQAHADEDKTRREEIEARNRLDGLVYSTEKTFNENREKLDPAEASNFESTIADAKKALESNDAAAMNEAAQRVEQASHKLAEAIYKGTASASSGSTGGEPGGGAQGGKEEDVIDTEYVDTDKT